MVGDQVTVAINEVISLCDAKTTKVEPFRVDRVVEND